MKLYPHQVEALDLVKDKNRCAIYYDMGLGKTYIGSEKMIQLDNKVNLIVCQKSKIDDWVNHYNDNYDYKVFNLTTPKDLSAFLGMSQSEKYHIVGIINYDLIWRRTAIRDLMHFTLLISQWIFT